MPRILREVNQNVDYKTRFVAIDGNNKLHEYVAFDNLTLHVDMASTTPVNLGNEAVDNLRYQSSPATGTALIGAHNTKSIKWAHCNDSSGANVAILTPNDAVPTVVGGAWQNYTIAFWVNLDEDATDSEQIIAGFAHGDGTGYHIRIESDRLYIKQFEDAQDSGSHYIQGYTTAAIATAGNFENRWNHVVITYDFTPSGQTWPSSGSPFSSTTRTGAWQIYLNGVAVATTSAPHASFNDVPDLGLTAAYIGSSWNGSYEMDGKISNFMFWNKDIDESSIKAVYHSFYNSVVNYKGIAIRSGLTTQNPRVAQQINDNKEDRSYITKSTSLVSRSIIGKNLSEPWFEEKDDAVVRSPQRIEKIQIMPNSAFALLDKCKVYIRGADGITVKAFALSRGSTTFQGGTNSDDIIVSITSKSRQLPASRRNENTLGVLLAQALGEAIEKESSLRLNVAVVGGSIYLEDQYLESRALNAVIGPEKASPVPAGSFKKGELYSPRVICHPKLQIHIGDGDATNTATAGQKITIKDSNGRVVDYFISDTSDGGLAHLASVANGATLKSAGSVTASRTAGSHSGIAVGFNLSGVTQNGLLALLKQAIEHQLGHGSIFKISAVPSEDNGVQGIVIIDLKPPTPNTSAPVVVSTNVGSLYTLTGELNTEDYIGSPEIRISVPDGDSNSVPAEKSRITIVTSDGTEKMYVTVGNSGHTLSTGDIIAASTDLGADNDGDAALAGGIAVVPGTTQAAYLNSFREAIKSQNGHGDKIKISSRFAYSSNNRQSILLVDQTAGPGVPGFFKNNRRAYDAGDGDNRIEISRLNRLSSDLGTERTETWWQWTASHGPNTVASVMEATSQYLRVEVLNTHRDSGLINHGLNQKIDRLTKAPLVGHNTVPDITSRLTPAPGSGYDTVVRTVRSGSINPFKEESLFASFEASPGRGVNIEHSKLIRKGEGVSLRKDVGLGFEGDISSKECITIEVDASGGSDVVLYDVGIGTHNDVRPTMAYLSLGEATPQWRALDSGQPEDIIFPGGSASGTANQRSGGAYASADLVQQYSERAYLGFGQGQANLLQSVSSQPVIQADEWKGRVDQGSLGYSEELLESEKNKLVFLESTHSPCINTFGFPSHPKYSGNENQTIDMSQYIDEDFLLERVAIEATIDHDPPTLLGENGIYSKSTTIDKSSLTGELRASGMTFFLLNQRKANLDKEVASTAFNLKTDADTEWDNIVRSYSSTTAYRLPAWYPKGARQAWGAVSFPGQPSSIIFDQNSVDVNGASHANATGWSFDRDGDGDGDTFALNSDAGITNALRLQNRSFITTSRTEHTGFRIGNTTRTSAARFSLPMGYDADVYLNTNNAYRLRFLARTYWTGASTKGSLGELFLIATYLDALDSLDPHGVTVRVGQVKIERDTWAWYDVPIKTEYGNNRNFNFSILCSGLSGGTYAANFIEIGAMEIYKVAGSSYEDTIRDIVGWGTAAAFPEEYEDKVESLLTLKCPDPRKDYALVMEGASMGPKKITVSFDPKAPVVGTYGTLTRSGVAVSNQKALVSSWSSFGRSGIPGIPSDRSIVANGSPGFEKIFNTFAPASGLEIGQPKYQSKISPYLLKKSDKLILGVQNLIAYRYLGSSDVGGNKSRLKPSKVTIKLYGSRVSNGSGITKSTTEALTSGAVHETIGTDLVLDQIETEISPAYAGCYLDRVFYGNPNLVETLRGGELFALGLISSVDIDPLLHYNDKDTGQAYPRGFAVFGDFDPFLPTFKSIESSPGAMQAGHKFRITDQKGVTKIYVSSTNGSHNNNPTVSGTDTVNGVTATRVYFYAGANFEAGVRQLAAAINDADGHGGPGPTQHICAVESTFDASVTNSRHVLQLIPRINSAREADSFDAGVAKITIDYTYSGTNRFIVTTETRFEHFGGATLKASGIALMTAAKQWNWHRKSKDGTRAVVARASQSSSGITGSFQRFVAAKEDSTFKYDSLVIPTYEFLSMFDCEGVVTQPGTSMEEGRDIHLATANDAGAGKHTTLLDKVVLQSTGVLLPIFQRCQIINQNGNLQTGYNNLRLAHTASDFGPAIPGSMANVLYHSKFAQGYDSNFMNLWSRWPFERGDRRSIDALNPTTFRLDLRSVRSSDDPQDYVKKGVPICRVNVPDMSQTYSFRFGEHTCARTEVGAPGTPNNIFEGSTIGAHFTGSLVGFGKAYGNRMQLPNPNDSSNQSFDGVHTVQQFYTSSIGSEWDIYAPRTNLNVRKNTLKALFGFETSFENTVYHKDVWYRARTGKSYPGGPSRWNGDAIADWPITSDVVVRGMRYGLDNYIPSEPTARLRGNRHGQFRDLLEQRKFTVTCDSAGNVSADRPITVTFISRAKYDDLGNIEIDRKVNVTPETTNSQNLSLYATSSVPYFDEWEEGSTGKAVWIYGRDRDTIQPDNQSAVTNIQVS